jgi:hypothetical protein
MCVTRASHRKRLLRLKLNPSKFAQRQYYNIGGITCQTLPIYITDIELQAALRLTDRDIKKMREFEGTWDDQIEKFVPSVLPLIEVIRMVIGNAVGLE